MNKAFIRREQLKRWLGNVVFPRQTQRWQAFVHAQPSLRLASEQHPKLLSKIYRPYLNAQFNCRDRVDALINHYETLDSQGLSGVTEIASQRSIALHTGLSKSEHAFAIVLTAVRDGHREGELCLQLFFQNECIYALNFSLARDGGVVQLVVGRLQGSAAPHAKELVRLATREFYACRPAGLLIHAVRNIAQVLGCQHLLLVGNRQRVALNPWRRYKLSADYDQLWLEAGATKRSDGYFQLSPLSKTELDFEQIASKKRSEARKKAALLDSIYASIELWMTQFKVQ